MITPPCDRIKSKEVSFMATCLCDSVYASAAECAVALLEKFGAKVNFPTKQTCCGQPAFNSGDFKNARKVVEHTMSVFNGDDAVVLPSSSCAAMLYHSTEIAFKDSDKKPQVAAFAKRVWELCDYLVNVLNVESIDGSYEAKIAIHNSCHSKGSDTPNAMLKLLKSIEGVEIIEFEGAQDCCGFGGTFSVVFPEISGELGVSKVQKISAAKPDMVVAADTSCLMHQQGIAQKQNVPYKTVHIAQVLFDALKNKGAI